MGGPRRSWRAGSSSRGFGPDDVTVGSKWGYTYTANWRVDAEVNEVKDLSEATLERQLTESQELLGNHLRLYQIHFGDARQRRARRRRGAWRSSRDSAPTAWRSGSRHRARGTGETIERALEVGGFDVVQSTWNLLERSAGPALEAAHDEGLGVIIKEALANGRLTDRGDVPELESAARMTGRTEDAIALAYVLAQPWVDVVLSGATTVPELESNLVARIARPRPRRARAARRDRRGRRDVLGEAQRAPLELNAAELATLLVRSTFF